MWFPVCMCGNVLVIIAMLKLRKKNVFKVASMQLYKTKLKLH